MAADGTPELSAIRCGEAIARIRTQRGWSRAQLLLRLYNELPATDPVYLSLSETWLARLENGRMVKIPRTVVEALCRALRCSRAERARVLLSADRSVLSYGEAEPDPAAEVLAVAMERVYTDARDILTALVRQRMQQRMHQQAQQQTCPSAHPTLDTLDALDALDALDSCALVASALDLLLARAPDESGTPAPTAPLEGRSDAPSQQPEKLLQRAR